MGKIIPIIPVRRGWLCSAKLHYLLRSLYASSLEEHLLVLFKLLPQERDTTLFTETFYFHLRSLREFRSAEVLMCSGSGAGCGQLGWDELKRVGTSLKMEFPSTFHLYVFFFFAPALTFLVWSNEAELDQEKKIHLKAVFFTRVVFRQIGFLTWLSKWLHQWQCWHKGSYRNPQKRKDLTEPSGSSLHLCQLNVFIMGLWFE